MLASARRFVDCDRRIAGEHRGMELMRAVVTGRQQLQHDPGEAELALEVLAAPSRRPHATGRADPRAYRRPVIVERSFAGWRRRGRRGKES